MGGNSYIIDGTELIVAVVAVSKSRNLYLEGDYYKIVVGTDGVTPVRGFN